MLNMCCARRLVLPVIVLYIIACGDVVDLTEFDQETRLSIINGASFNADTVLVTVAGASIDSMSVLLGRGEATELLYQSDASEICASVAAFYVEQIENTVIIMLVKTSRVYALTGKEYSWFVRDDDLFSDSEC